MSAIVSGLSRWYFTPVPARRLAMLRIMIGLYAWVFLVARSGGMVGVANLSVRQFAPQGPVALLNAPLPYGVVVAIAIAAMGSGAAFVLGYRHRWSGPVFALTFLWVTSYRNSWSMVFHTENLMVLHLLVVGLAPGAADVWSLDARGRAHPHDDGRYGWPVRLLCAVTVTTYVLAGTAKLSISGVEWITSDTLRGLVAYDNLRKVELGDAHSPIGALLVSHGWLFPPLAAGSLVIELGAPVALLGRRIGRVWCALAWSFHAGVVAVMAILFHYPLFGFGFAAFFDVERIGDRFVAWRNKRRESSA